MKSTQSFTFQEHPHCADRITPSLELAIAVAIVWGRDIQEHGMADTAEAFANTRRTTAVSRCIDPPPTCTAFPIASIFSVSVKIQFHCM